MMPVNKIDGQYLRKTKIPYEIIPRATVNVIENPDALAIWLYLITRPENWVVRKVDLMERFSLGQTRYSRARKELVNKGLLTKAYIKDPDTNNLQGSVTWVNHTQVIDIPEGAENRTLGDPIRSVNSIYKEDHKDLKENHKNICSIPFSDFWNVWPKRVDKVDAEIAWNKLSDKKRAIAIEDCRTRYNETEKQYIPSPRKYLLKEKWTDERLSGESVASNDYVM